MFSGAWTSESGLFEAPEQYGHTEDYRLEFFSNRNSLSPCQYTNFSAKNAGKRAKSLFVRRIGKGQNVLTAAQKSFRGNFPHSLPAAAAARRLPALPGADIVAAVADADVINSIL